MTDEADKAGRVRQSIAATLLAALLCLSAAAQHPQQAITGKVVGVSDGDTITVLDANKRQHKIRLDGIDAPESSQNFGARAKQSLSDLVFGKTVTVLGSKQECSFGETAQFGITQVYRLSKGTRLLLKGLVVFCTNRLESNYIVVGVPLFIERRAIHYLEI
jgi:hypothetical protein